MLLTLQLKLKIKKRPHSFNHNCNHYSLSEGERQQKKKKKEKKTKSLRMFDKRLFHRSKRKGRYWTKNQQFQQARLFSTGLTI